MTAEWYYAKNKQKVGPLTAAQLKQLVRSGELSRNDMVWKEGMAKWTPAGQVKGLFPIPAEVGHTAQASAQPSPETTFDNFAESPAQSGSSHRRSKSVGPKLMLWGGLSIVLLIGMALAVIYFSRTNTRITEDYFPRSPGGERSFVFREYRPDGSAVTTQRAFRWKDEGTLEWWDKDKPNQRSPNSYRINQGFVELRVVKQQQGDGEWEPLLKLGAKPGDTWGRHYKEKNYAESISFRYEEFKTHQQRPCVVITYEMKGSAITVKGHRWYLKGVGLVRDEAKILWNDSWKPYTEIVYAEWGMDSSASTGGKSNPKQGDPTTNKTATPAETRPADPTPTQGATELTRLAHKDFVIYYKGFTEDQMKAYIDHIDKYWITGKEPRRTYGVFYYQVTLAKQNKGMRIERENDFTKIMIPVDNRMKNNKTYFANVGLPVFGSLAKIDESVKGKVGYATCNEDWTVIYTATDSFRKH
jgi:hypothetical protein